MREGDDLITVLDVPAPLRRARRELRGADARRPGDRRGRRRHPARRGADAARPRDAAPPAPRPRRPARRRQRPDPAPPQRRAARRCSSSFSATITEENLRADESMFSRLRRALHAPPASDPARGPRRPRARGRRRSPSCSRSRPPASRRSTDDDDVVEYVLYGAAGELPSAARAAGHASATRSSRSPPARSPTTGPSAGATFHHPVEIAGRLRVRAPWHEPAAAGGLDRHRDRAGAGVRHRRARDDAAAASSCSSSSPRAGDAHGGRCSTSAPARACSRSPPRSSATTPVAAVDHERESVARRARQRASPTASRSRSPRSTCAATRCRRAPTITANLLRPLLLELAERARASRRAR